MIDQGSDPSFNHVRVVQIPTGETLATLPVSGVGAVTESPDRLMIAAADQPSDHPNIVKLYNLANPSAPPRVVTLPQIDWNAFELVWSRDSRQVYVAMFPSVDNPKGELYRIDAVTGGSTLVASNLPIDTRLLSVTADGRQILAAQQNSVDLIDLASGSIQRRPIPAEAIIAHIN